MSCHLLTKPELTAKASMAQPVSQPTVYANGLSSKDLFSLQHVRTPKRLIQTLNTHGGVADQLAHLALTGGIDGASEQGISQLSIQKVECFKENGYGH
jgi:hypothetical protein